MAVLGGFSQYGRTYLRPDGRNHATFRTKHLASKTSWFAHYEKSVMPCVESYFSIKKCSHDFSRCQ